MKNGMLSAVIVSAVLCAAAESYAITIDMDALGATEVCLHSLTNGKRGYCTDANTNFQQIVALPVTVDGTAGIDKVVVRSTAMCSCVCTNLPDGANATSYNYGGSSVTINGDEEDDVLIAGFVGGGASHTTNAGADDDQLGGGAGAPDMLSGAGGADVLEDRAGGSDTHSGSSGADCIDDEDGSWTSCDCGADNDTRSNATTSACTSCETSGGACAITCPEII